jgi:hypothetical protein
MDTFLWGLTSLPGDHALVSENILDFVIYQWNTLHWNHENACLLRNIKPLWLLASVHQFHGYRLNATKWSTRHELSVCIDILQYATSYDCLTVKPDREKQNEKRITSKKDVPLFSICNTFLYDHVCLGKVLPDSTLHRLALAELGFW